MAHLGGLGIPHDGTYLILLPAEAGDAKVGQVEERVGVAGQRSLLRPRPRHS